MQTVAQVQSVPPPPVSAPNARQREAVRQGAALTVIALLAILILGAFALVVLARYRRSMLEGGNRARRKKVAAPRDPWAESAKRMTARSPSDDDTVDIDPDDLSPGDVDGDEPDGKRGPRP